LASGESGSKSARPYDPDEPGPPMREPDEELPEDDEEEGWPEPEPDPDDDEAA
jgi:hypothetical protein